MPDANPLVSIVVRTEDRPLLLERALASIAAQTYRPLEVVVVNDGSAALDEARLRAVLGDVALAAVRHDDRPDDDTHGRLVATLHDDEELEPLHVEALVAAAGADGDARDPTRAPDGELDALRQRLAAATAAVEEQRRRAEGFRERARRAESTLRSVEASRAWRIAEWLRRHVLDLVLPPGSRRRAAYDGAPRGPGGAAAGAPAAVVELPIPPGALAAGAGGASVSVVIPTLNGGADLAALLAALRRQRGLGSLELIAVDSGSTDGTIALCERSGVTVLPYRGAAFNHGAARDQGARAASGRYLVFVSQDAVPESDDAIATLVGALSVHPATAAATGRQVARADADTFTRWQLACYDERVLDYAGDTAVGLRPGAALTDLAPAARRRVAQLNNVLCCVRRDVLAQVPFRAVPYAEDLDLGLRLLAASYRLAFLPSVRVVHSHDRPAEYHLRRGYVDWRHLVPILGFPTRDWAAVGVTGAAALAGGLVALGRQVAAVVSGSGLDASVAHDRTRLLAALDRADAGPAAADATGLGELLSSLAAALGAAGAGAGGERARVAVRDQLAQVLGEIEAFAERHGVLADRPEELLGALSRAFASVAGWCLADFASWSARTTGSAAVLELLDERLAGGV